MSANGRAGLSNNGSFGEQSRTTEESGFGDIFLMSSVSHLYERSITTLWTGRGRGRERSTCSLGP
jgi:hypothetical protein